MVCLRLLEEVLLQLITESFIQVDWPKSLSKRVDSDGERYDGVLVKLQYLASELVDERCTKSPYPSRFAVVGSVQQKAPLSILEVLFNTNMLRPGL